MGRIRKYIRFLILDINLDYATLGLKYSSEFEFSLNYKQCTVSKRTVVLKSKVTTTNQ